QHRNNFQHDPKHHPPTYDAEAREETCKTHLPYPASKQEQANEKKHTDKEMGNAHTTITRLGGLLNDDPSRHSLLWCASYPITSRRDIPGNSTHQRTLQTWCPRVLPLWGEYPTTHTPAGSF